MLPWSYLDQSRASGSPTVPFLSGPSGGSLSERRGGKTKAVQRQVNEARRQLCAELHQYSTEDRRTLPTMSQPPGAAATAEGRTNRREKGIPGKCIRNTSLIELVPPYSFIHSLPFLPLPPEIGQSSQRQKSNISISNSYTVSCHTPLPGSPRTCSVSPAIKGPLNESRSMQHIHF